MTTHAPVNFETFYFFELLEKIRQDSRETYDKESQEYLEKLLQYLESEPDAHRSIEKLAGAQSTSDLAIFFSDILDQLHRVSPEESLEKIGDRVNDFLEIFQVFLQNDEWRASVDAEIYQSTGSFTLPPAGEPQAEVSFIEFCRQIVQEQIQQYAEQLPAGKRERFLACAGALMDNPDLANQVELSLDHPAAADFSARTYRITQLSEQMDIAENMPQFREEVQSWVQTIYALMADQPEEMALILLPAASPPPEAAPSDVSVAEEQPFESLFEAAESQFPAEAETQEGSDAASELEDLVRSVSQRESRVAQGLEMSEEEKERRQLLRDYVVNEIHSFTDEALEAIDQLHADPGNTDAIIRLKDAIKGLKDLGQIHAYPAVEQAADHLLRDFNQLRQQDRVFSETEKPLLADLFALLPGYVDAAVAGDDRKSQEQIQATIDELHAQLFDVEPVSNVFSADTLEGAFQDVAGRYARKIYTWIESPESAAPADLAAIFDNLQFWNALLLPDSACQTVHQLQVLLSGENFSALGEEDRQFLADLVKSWESAYVNTPEEMWADYARQLDALQARLTGAMDVTTATAAFHEVTLRQIQTLQTRLGGQAPERRELLAEELPRFLDTFCQNCALVNHTDLHNLATGLQLRIRTADPLADPEQFSAALNEVLESVKAKIAEPEREIPNEDILAALDRALHAQEAPGADIAAEEEWSEFADEAMAEAETVEEEPAGDAFAEDDELIEDLADTLEQLEEQPLAPEPPGAEAADAAPELTDAGEILDILETEEGKEESEAAVAQPAEAEPPVADTGEEILEVFKIEVYSYLNELQELLDALEQNVEDRDIWRTLGVTAHTLKGSSQMMGRGDIAELAEPLDRAVDLLEGGIIPPKPELVNIFRSLVMGIKERIHGQPVDGTALREDLEDYIRNARGLTAAETATAPRTEPEYIHLKEQDPELLTIFQNEVVSNFDIIEKNLTNLEKFTFDKEAVQQSERATHEIRAAAKMLGIVEIAAIADLLEELFARLGSREISDLEAAIPTARRAMYVIRQLTDEHKVLTAVYQAVIHNLNQLVEGAPPEELPPVQPPPAAKEPAGPKVTEPEPVAEAESAEPPPSGEPSPFTDVPIAAEAEAETAPPETAPIITSTEEPPEVTPQVLELYLQEAREQLDDINYLLLKLEKDPVNEELQHHLMRCMHTLKGSSGMVFATHIESLSHRSEDILERHILTKEPLPAELFDLMFEVVDEFRFIMEALEETGRERVKKHDELRLRLDNYFRSLMAGVEGETAAETAPPAPGEEVPPAEEREAETAAPQTAEPQKDHLKKETYLRLSIEKMNHLLNLAAESVISTNQFKNQLDGLKNFHPMLNTNLKLFRETEDYLNTILREGHNLQEKMMEGKIAGSTSAEALKKQVESLQRVLKNVRSLQDEITSITHSLKETTKTYDENLQKLSKLGNELLDEVMQARLVPINLLFQRFHRPIRDLARKMEKQIRLHLSGEETELDRTLIDELYEPLLHIIRNAIDHGLETAAEREAAGKPPEGLIEIKASRDRNQVIIEVRDDGRGIDVETIRRLAVEKELVSQAEAREMSDAEIFEFLFYPGFSTAKEATLVSGRGVGLDAVKVQIEKAKGDIRMFTEPGKGTTFSIRVPISLSVIQSMLVDVNGYVYSVPLLQVEETLHVSGQDLLQEEGKYFIRYRERQIPVIQLAKLLKIRDTVDRGISAAISYPVIIVQDEGRRVALLVDKIIRREEILIKSLGPGLRRLKYISGGSIMADGQVVLVLDIPQIIHDIGKSTTGMEAAAPAAVSEPQPIRETPRPERPLRRIKRVEGRKPVALIVDDSLSIRKYLSSLLMQKGYITDTARNGYEALELLNKQEFDIMITDLEMPKLSGYELIETVRYDQRFNQFPIIVLTGRAGENFRQLTSELGADAYIIKPFKDRELYEQIEKFIEYKD